MRKFVLSSLVLAIALGAASVGLAQSAAEGTLQQRANAGDGFAAYDLATSLLKPDATDEQVRTGLDYLNSAVESGVPEAMIRLGDLARDGGFGVEADGRRAEMLYLGALDLGHTGATMRLAEMYRKGATGLARDIARAAALLETAIESDNTTAMRTLASMLVDGSLPENNARARELFERAIAGGDEGAAIVFARELAKDRFAGVGALEAFELVRPLAANGNDGAKRVVADLLRNGGRRLDKDPAAALEGYVELAEGGDVWAARAAADMMIRGEAGTADFDGGIGLLTPFADNGDAGVLAAIGNYYAQAEFGQQSAAMAAGYYERAVAGGDKGAIMRLADLYRNGAPGLDKDPARAAALLETGVENGLGAAMRVLAGMLLDGSLPEDSERARRLFERAIDAGDDGAAIVFARELAKGRFDGAGVAEAFELVRPLAATGNATAKRLAADLLRAGGDGLNKDPATALQYYQEVAEAGDVSAARAAADMLIRGETAAADFEGGLALIRPFAEAGDASVLAAIGNYYAQAEFGHQSAQAAASYFERAIAGGNAGALMQMAELYRKGGPDLAADPARAVAPLEAAIANGNAAAMRVLAGMLLDGSLPADGARAARLYEAAIAAGDTNAAISFASLLISGKGLAPDPTRAINLLTPIAETDNSQAKLMLADLFRRGAAGVPVDLGRAFELVDAAAALNDSGALRRKAEMLARGEGTERDVDAAVALLEPLSAAGDIGATVLLGELFARAEFDNIDAGRAIGYYQAAANAGDTAALLQVGDLLSGKEFGRNDAAGAIAAYRGAAEKGNIGAYLRLADLYRNGMAGLPRDFEIAADYLEQAIALGNNSARTRLGRMLLDGSLAVDAARGAELLRTAIENGDDGAAILLAGYLARGQGVAADGPAALALLGPLVAEGNISAINLLGDLYRTGAAAIERDPPQAAALYEQAIADGDPGAARRLGEMLVRGDAGPADFDRGVTLVGVAADAGDVGALLLLGDFHSKSEYGHVDPALAASFYQRASDAGNAAGLTRLGDLYRRGTEGLDADVAAAASFYERSAAQGDNTARRNLAAMLLDGSAGTDAARAVALYEEAIAAGDAVAAMAMLKFHAEGKHTAPNYERARGYFETAQRLGDTGARLAWGDLLVTGPLATSHLAEGVAMLREAAADGVPNALTTLSRLQMNGVVPGATVETALTALISAADKGDAAAVPMLIQTLRDGYSDKVKRTPASARRLFERYAGLLSTDERNLHEVLLDATQAMSTTQYAAVASKFDALPATSQTNVLDTLRWRQQNAYVYLMQSILADHGYYDGRPSGRLNSTTVAAFGRACLAILDRARCERGPLSGEAAPVLGFLVTQPKPGAQNGNESPQM